MGPSQLLCTFLPPPPPPIYTMPCYCLDLFGCFTIICPPPRRFVGGVALITPNNLSDYISLVGAMASSALAFIFPPLLHIMVFACASPKMDLSDESLSRHAELNDKKVDMHTTPLQCTYKALWIGKDAAIFVFGIVGAVFGTYSTIQEIVNTFNGVPINKQCQGA